MRVGRAPPLLSICQFLVMISVSRSAPLDLSQLPKGARFVFMNIGSHTDPVLPPNRTSGVISIACEPIVHASIAPSDGLYVLPVAVSDRTGFSMMGLHGGHASKAASSLSEPTERMRQSFRKDDPSVIVPVASMSSVLDSIPPSLEIWFLKTDMQGEDARALKSAGAALRRAHYIMSEVTLRGVTSYRGSQNDYCRDWLPHMLAHGYIPTLVVYQAEASGRHQVSC